MVALLREIDRWSRAGGDRAARGRPGLGAASPALAERIARLRAEGLSLSAIAARLNQEGVPTPRGGAQWRASSVQSALGYRRPRPPLPGAPPPHPPGPLQRSGSAGQAGSAEAQAAPVTALIEQFGALGVFLLMVPESACIPVPSEVTLLFSGFAVSQHWMSLPLAVLAATAGNVVGSLIAYAVGASRLLDRLPGSAPAALPLGPAAA